MDLVAYLGTVAGTTTVAVAGMVAVVRTFAGRLDEIGRRFGDVNSRFDDVNSRFDDVNSRFDDVNSRIDHLRTDLGGRMDRMERQLETVTVAVTDLGQRVTAVEAGRGG